MTCLNSPITSASFFFVIVAAQQSQQRNRNTLTVSVSLCDLQQQKSRIVCPNPSSTSAIPFFFVLRPGALMCEKVLWEFPQTAIVLPGISVFWLLHLPRMGYLYLRDMNTLSDTSIQITLPGESIDFSRLSWYRQIRF